MVKLELLHSARNPTEFRALREELEAVPPCPIGAGEWRRALDVYQALCRSGPGNDFHRSVGHADLLIAAAAEAAGVSLLHYDSDYDTIGKVTGQPMRWLAPRGSTLMTEISRDLLDDCVHCGFCLPTCPTYGPLWQEEMDSPRGRILLMSGLVDGTVELSPTTVDALRPLPRVHGLRDVLPVRCAVRPSDRTDPRACRGAPRAVRRRAAVASAGLRDRSRIRGGSGSHWL